MKEFIDLSAPKPLRGRPTAGDTAKSEYIHIRLTPEQKEEIKAKADAAGKSVSDWLLGIAL